MTTSEHLNKIKAKCEELLAIAAKRTPGKWECSPSCYDTSHEATQFPSGPVLNYGKKNELDMPFGYDDDADFIASCAGPAEAGWRATIAAIDDLEEIHESTPLGEYAAWDALNKILAAWPEELL